MGLSLSGLMAHDDEELLLHEVTDEFSEEEEEEDLSKTVIRKFVTELLNDENININGFPDILEEQLYHKMVTVAIGLLSKVIDTTEVKLLGHRIKFLIEPLDK